MDFETLGIATAFVGSWMMVVLLGFTVIELTWKLAKRIVGMTRILMAIEKASIKE